MGKQEIEKIISLAVEAGRMAGERTARDAVKATEKRLYALPLLRIRVDERRGELDDIVAHGVPERSRGISRFVRSGIRLTPDEIREAVILDMRADIAKDEYEIAEVERALKSIEADPYYKAVSGRYLEDLPDERIAEAIPCDVSTIWRNRKRLVQRLAVLLYGADAVK